MISDTVLEVGESDNKPSEALVDTGLGTVNTGSVTTFGGVIRGTEGLESRRVVAIGEMLAATEGVVSRVAESSCPDGPLLLVAAELEKKGTKEMVGEAESRSDEPETMLVEEKG